MTTFILGLLLIWLGGFATGFVAGLHTVFTQIEKPRTRARIEDLYPKRDNDAP